MHKIKFSLDCIKTIFLLISYMLICNKFTVYLIGIIFNKKIFKRHLRKKKNFPKL